MTMTAKKQTAVMWLIEQQRDINLRFEAGIIDISTFHVEHIGVVYKALQMERDQIEEAWLNGDNSLVDTRASNYYTDTYGE